MLGDAVRGIFFPTLWPLVASYGGTRASQGLIVAAFSMGRMVISPYYGPRPARRDGSRRCGPRRDRLDAEGIPATPRPSTRIVSTPPRPSTRIVSTSRLPATPRPSTRRGFRRRGGGSGDAADLDADRPRRRDRSRRPILHETRTQGPAHIRPCSNHYWRVALLSSLEPLQPLRGPDRTRARLRDVGRHARAPAPASVSATGAPPRTRRGLSMGPTAAATWIVRARRRGRRPSVGDAAAADRPWATPRRRRSSVGDAAAADRPWATPRPRRGSSVGTAAAVTWRVCGRCRGRDADILWRRVAAPPRP